MSAIGGQRSEDERGSAFISDIPNAPSDNMTFVPVPEAKKSKNRLHGPEGNEFCVFAAH